MPPFLPPSPLFTLTRTNAPMFTLSPLPARPAAQQLRQRPKAPPPPHRPRPRKRPRKSIVARRAGPTPRTGRPSAAAAAVA